MSDEVTENPIRTDAGCVRAARGPVHRRAVALGEDDLSAENVGSLRRVLGDAMDALLLASRTGDPALVAALSAVRTFITRARACGVPMGARDGHSGQSDATMQCAM